MEQSKNKIPVEAILLRSEMNTPVRRGVTRTFFFKENITKQRRSGFGNERLRNSNSPKNPPPKKKHKTPHPVYIQWSIYIFYNPLPKNGNQMTFKLQEIKKTPDKGCKLRSCRVFLSVSIPQPQCDFSFHFNSSGAERTQDAHSSQQKNPSALPAPWRIFLGRFLLGFRSAFSPWV